MTQSVENCFIISIMGFDDVLKGIVTVFQATIMNMF